MNPKVTFIIPCYNLAHFLQECVESVLSQTFGDFEILIMDDCSPDNTPEVARSFADARVRHVRNETNLGNIANYNRGIGLARGEYVWLISADDQLRSRHVLERYVRVMDENPRVGFVFCPCVELMDGAETGVLVATRPGDGDVVYRGTDFFDLIVRRNVTSPDGESRWFTVEAPAVMVRKECYDRVSLFPKDLPHAGDRFIWSLFALYYDVAFLAEPMVRYRVHGSSMMQRLISDDRARRIFGDEIAMCWRLKERAEEIGAARAVGSCDRAIVREYLRWLDQIEGTRITTGHFEESVRGFARDRREEAKFLALVYAGLGDYLFWRRELPEAKRFYMKAVRRGLRTLGPRAVKCLIKAALIGMGGAGACLIEAASSVGRRIARLKRSGRPPA